jgi:NAD(P)H-dependent flavin oxidoreductase YrpB (nitropropane dioxygenase family)
MLYTELSDMLGIRYPIIQAGMGPYSTNRLAVAAANAGVLGIISTSGFGYLSGVAREVVAMENRGWDAQFRGDGPRALLPAGEVAGLVGDLPTVKELVERTVKEAEELIQNMPSRFLKG